MSHLKERVEKNCLNCNAQVIGKYCHVCGQENILPKESLGHLINHYFQDITHFDGKFFSSIKLLIFRPGYLSTQYVKGKRSAYLNPIRMYVFTSAIFFLIFFSFVQKDKEIEVEIPSASTDYLKIVENEKVKIESELLVQKDSIKLKEGKIRLVELDKAIDVLKNVPSLSDSAKNRSTPNTKLLSFSNEYTSIKKYDSVQQKLPPNKRDGWMLKKINYKTIEAKTKYNDDPNKIMNAILHKFLHSFPQLLFLSLPFFAILLKLLYIRQKQLYYVNHLIVTIHLYCAVFILLLLIFGLNGLENKLHWPVLSWLTTIVSFAIIFYQYKVLYNFYQQSISKTILKFLILNFLMIIIFIFLAALIFIFSAFQI